MASNENSIWFQTWILRLTDNAKTYMIWMKHAWSDSSFSPFQGCRSGMVWLFRRRSEKRVDGRIEQKSYKMTQSLGTVGKPLGLAPLRRRPASPRSSIGLRKKGRGGGKGGGGSAVCPPRLATGYCGWCELKWNRCVPFYSLCVFLPTILWLCLASKVPTSFPNFQDGRTMCLWMRYILLTHRHRTQEWWIFHEEVTAKKYF